MSGTSNRRGGDARGYTLVEVMVALTILGTGILGILGMENAAIAANRRAQEMTLATHIARRWQERLRADALLWNSPSARTSISDLGTDTQYLCAIVGCSTGTAQAFQWIVPVAGPGSPDTAAYDAFGNEVPVGNSAARYCVNTRFSWLRPDAPARQGLIRAEIRVWWYREGSTQNMAYAGCGSAGALQSMGGDTNTLQFIYAASAVAGNPL